MAAAFLHHYAGDRVAVRSAGSMPASEVNPGVVATMAEIDIELMEAAPKQLTDEAVQASDVVITMGCGDVCPIYPGKRYVDWDLDDPAGKTPDEIRPIRNEVDRRIKGLLVDLFE